MRKNPEYVNLIDPEHLGGTLSRRKNRQLADMLQGHADAVAAQAVHMPPMGVVVQAREKPYPLYRARHPRGWNEIFHQIIHTLGGVQRQQYDSLTEAVVVVDEGHNMKDAQAFQLDAFAEPEVGRLPFNVRLVEVGRRTTHAQALNIGARAILNPPEGPKPDVVAMTEKGARYATDQALRTIALGVNQGFEGVFGAHLAGEGASDLESRFYGGLVLKRGGLRTPISHPDPRPGLMSASRAGYEAHFLSEHPFPEEYQRGGSDWRMAWHADVQFQPAASIQWVENLGLFALAAHLGEQMQYTNPSVYPRVR